MVDGASIRRDLRALKLPKAHPLKEVNESTCYIDTSLLFVFNCTINAFCGK